MVSEHLVIGSGKEEVGLIIASQDIIKYPLEGDTTSSGAIKTTLGLQISCLRSQMNAQY